MATAVDPTALHHIFYALGGKAVKDVWAYLLSTGPDLVHILMNILKWRWMIMIFPLSYKVLVFFMHVKK